MMSLILEELLPTPTARKLPAVSSSESLAENTAFCDVTFFMKLDRSEFRPVPAIGFVKVAAAVVIALAFSLFE